MKRIRLIILATMAAATLAGCAPTLGTSPKGLEVPIERAALKFSIDIKEGGYQLVNSEELKRWVDEKKQVTIISTLPLIDDKKMGRIPTAINSAIPKTETELTSADQDRLLQVAGPDKTQPLVLYCGFVSCRRSHIGAKFLVEKGYTNVYRYPGGISAWKELKYGVIK